VLEGYIDDYVKVAGIGAEKASPLFRTLGGRGRKQLTGERMTRQDARRMIVRRAYELGDYLAQIIEVLFSCHS
jgi:hypothetical protein